VATTTTGFSATIGILSATPSLNSPAVDLNSTVALTIAENQPIGTIVGEFNATDPDGDSITYHFVSGDGDGNNSLFDLNASSGVLTSKVVFDFESNASTYTIRVQARDEYNASVEGDFTVTVLDLLEKGQTSYLAGSAGGMEMIWVEPGSFSMGSPYNESGRWGDETQRNITITKGFYLGKYELTQMSIKS
jgi:hypothetical protein